MEKIHENTHVLVLSCNFHYSANIIAMERGLFQ